jgi:DNA-binding IclR family transcriptional regulator
MQRDSTAERETQNESVARALQILFLFQTDSELGLREMSRKSGLSIAVVHRIAETMCRYRFLRQVPESRRYVLGGSLLELAQRFREEDRFAQECIAVTDRLRDETRETIALHVLRDGMRINVLESRSPHVLRQVAAPGASMPLTHGAIDIVMCAVAGADELERINMQRARAHIRDRLPTPQEIDHFKRHGWSISTGARTPGATGIAAVVPHPEGIYVLALHGPRDRIRATGHALVAQVILTGASEMRDRVAALHASL